ncbi:MAG: phenylalanine--tRNA ligase subunit beta [Chitinophagaceae bacterium]|nr:phenylalanine--tRNA ligase subunit beta [Chitinophagaceae bacterium]
MKISYKWLSEYLPVDLEPERLSRILTSIGLEVESLEKFEEVKGGLQGLVIGEVLTTEKHPNADKLTLTTVNIGTDTPLFIVCGAPNVAVGQKVVVAPVGATIYPTQGEPLTMKLAKIRGSESQGMICAEDEIGLGTSHAGILVLPADVMVGQPAAEYFKPYSDWVFEIGLTPNRMDAMSHWGVARDVCAYLSHHDKKDLRAKIPVTNGLKADNLEWPIQVSIENTQACKRYSGISIANITVKPSPVWMQQRLKAIGLRPINNIVDITNFIQHETGQPLHAFDAEKIGGKKILVKNLPEGTPFVTLDEKERKLNAQDLMICDASEGMCIAGVFGGVHSGVSDNTRHIFLESAWFNPIDIRKTSFRHGLRTDAATRFEKGIDISNTVNVLKRAASLIKEFAGGQIASEIVDIYPQPVEKTKVGIKYHYLKKLSGKNYHPDTVKRILESLGFEITKEGIDELWVAVPYSKPDISLPADIVEEIVRIDGLDNITIPTSITISPSTEENYFADTLKEKIANYLTGLGFHEIMTNSITNSAYYSPEELAETVKMINNLSAELDILRPSMLETGLESVAHNLNRKNLDLRFFEFGKTYRVIAPGQYEEKDHLTLYVTGNSQTSSWKGKSVATDAYYLKGVLEALFSQAGVEKPQFQSKENEKISGALVARSMEQDLALTGTAAPSLLQRFDIKQPVYIADIDWTNFTNKAALGKIQYMELARFPSVNRDLALVVDKAVAYEQVENSVKKLKLDKLKDVQLFDIFESDKLGAGKKSLALSFTFQDTEKTLTDKEIENWTGKIIQTLEKELNAEIRK